MRTYGNWYENEFIDFTRYVQFLDKYNTWKIESRKIL